MYSWFFRLRRGTKFSRPQAHTQHSCVRVHKNRVYILEILEQRTVLTGLTPASCLDEATSIVTVSGPQSGRFDEVALPAGMAVNAEGASWYALGDTQVTVRDSTDVCFRKGLIEHNYSDDASWAETHTAHALRLFNAPNAVVEGTRLKNSGDGISIYAGTSDFTVRGVFIENMHDDCIESDDLEGGVIEDSLLESCYVTFAARARDGQTVDGSQNTWVIRDTLA